MLLPVQLDRSSDLVSSVEVLGGHGTHASWDSSSWYDPLGQSSHVPRVLFRYVPGEQLTEQCKIYHNEEWTKEYIYTNIGGDAAAAVGVAGADDDGDNGVW